MPHYPQVGDKAIDFTLPSTRGEVSLSSMLRDGAALMVFYPRDRTLVCTRQLCNYRDNLSVFEELDVHLLAINDDPLDLHRAFSDKYGFPFPLASDEQRVVCDAYGVLLGRLKAHRALVLVGEDGRVWWRHSELRLFHRDAAELHSILAELRSER
jgi:peroxiredoxin